jgi:hypothetical protein
MRLRTIAAFAAAVGVAGAFAPLAAQAESWPTVRIANDVAHDVSPPLRDLAASMPKYPSEKEHHVDRVKRLPHHAMNGPRPTDGVLQSEPGAASVMVDGINFAGIGQGDYGFSPNAAPPDTNGAIGSTQYVQYVNESIAVFDKTTGALLLGPVKGSAIWKGFKSQCAKNDDGDPIAIYDKLANRWVVSQFFVNGKTFLECVAVSKTPDATGAYNRYEFSYGTHDFNDYPKISVWPDGYYVTYNIFKDGKSFSGAKVCAFDRVSMMAGSAAGQQCIQLTPQFGGLLPSDLDGKTLPPKKSPAYVLGYDGDLKSLDLWQFHVNWAKPKATTFTGPVKIAVAPFSPACGQGGGGACMPQKGTTNLLDSLSDRVMYRLAYRNYGDHESLVVNHSVDAPSGVGVRWYELRDPSAAKPTLFQSGTFAPTKKSYRWMGSVAMDKIGNLAIGYSETSAATFPSIFYAGRLATDKVGKLQAERPMFAGTGSQTGTLDRWGDYSALTVDPVDDCTFWYTTEYLKTSGTFNWSTRVGSFSFPSCTKAK